MLRINARMNVQAGFARPYAIKTNVRVERDSRGFHAHEELSSKHLQVRRMRRWEEFFHNNVENAGVLNCDNCTREAARLILRLFFWQMQYLRHPKACQNITIPTFTMNLQTQCYVGRWAKKAFLCNHLFLHLLAKKFLLILRYSY